MASNDGALTANATAGGPQAAQFHQYVQDQRVLLDLVGQAEGQPQLAQRLVHVAQPGRDLAQPVVAVGFAGAVADLLAGLDRALAELARHGQVAQLAAQLAQRQRGLDDAVLVAQLLVDGQAAAAKLQRRLGLSQLAVAQAQPGEIANLPGEWRHQLTAQPAREGRPVPKVRPSAKR